MNHSTAPLVEIERVLEKERQTRIANAILDYCVIDSLRIHIPTPDEQRQQLWDLLNEPMP